MDLARAVQNERKDEQEINFIVDDSRLLLDTQEAKNVSKHTVVR